MVAQTTRRLADQADQADISSILSSDVNNNEDSNQYLTFIMAEEEYGVDILCVQEIRGWDAATPLPNAPSHIKGVINLRGTIVPIIDMRLCFGLPATDYTALTVIIVLKIETAEQSRIVGIVVDAVSDVYTINDRDMKDAPDLGDAMDTQYIHGLVEVNETMVILLQMEELLNLDGLPDLSQLKDTISTQAAAEAANKKSEAETSH